MNQPKIKLQLEPIDQLVELLAFIGLCLLLILPVIYYSELPNEIPIHFGANGKADGYSGKGMIWFLPVVGMLIYMLMFWINKYPHTFNYPQKITEENAPKQYRIVTRVIRISNAITCCFFAYLTYSIIQVALGNQHGLGTYSMIVFLIVLFVPIIYYLYQATRK